MPSINNKAPKVTAKHHAKKHSSSKKADVDQSEAAPCDSAEDMNKATREADDVIKEEEEARKRFDKLEKKKTERVNNLAKHAAAKAFGKKLAVNDINELKDKQRQAKLQQHKDMLEERALRREEHRKKSELDHKNQERIMEARKIDKARRLGNPVTKHMKKHIAEALAKDEDVNEDEDKDADATIAKKLEDKEGDSAATAKAEANRQDENEAKEQKATSSFAQKNAEEFGDAFDKMAEGDDDNEQEDGNQVVQLRKDAAAEATEEGDSDLIVNEMKDISETKRTAVSTDPIQEVDAVVTRKITENEKERKEDDEDEVVASKKKENAKNE